jgi:peptide deformylase
MAILKIEKYGNPILQKKAEPIKEINQEILELAQNMVQTMHAAPGIGLAAPQVNVSKRLITVDLSVGEKKEDLIILINPEILRQEGESTVEEGCLSVPDIHENVKRPLQVTVKGIDLEGNEIVLEAENLMARVFCHEIDHINGKLFFEHLSPLKKTLIKKKLKKKVETGKGR